MMNTTKLLKSLREVESILDNDIDECGFHCGGCRCSCYPVECLIEAVERGDYDKQEIAT